MSKQRRKMLTCGAITSRKLASVNSDTERVYWRIYMASDMYGTMEGDPWDVWQQALPGVTGFTEAIVADCVERLAAVGLVQRFESEGASWVHVVNHDKHQSSEFLRKRGTRRTPVPPTHIGGNAGLRAENAGLRADKGRERRPTASQAEGRPTRELSAPTVSVSVSGEDLTSSSVVRPQGSPILRPRPTTLGDDGGDVAAEVEFVESATAELAQLTNSEGEAAAVAENLLTVARNPHPKSKQRYPLSQWQAAVSEFGDRVRRGDTPTGSVVGYIIGMVPTAGAKLEIRPDVIGSDVPDPDRDAARAAADAERRIAELYGSAS